MGTIAAAGRLAAASRTVAYNLELQQKANLFDIYTMKEGLYNRENPSFPKDSVFLKVEGKDSTTIISMKEHLQLPGVYGQTAARGTEEPPQTLSMTTYQDNYRKVIPIPGYGLQRLEADRYKLYDVHKQDLGLWNEEQRGYEIRMAFLETFGVNLQNATSNVFAAITANINWNPNVFVPGVRIQSMPTYSTNRATFTNNICSALVATGGFGQFMARTLNAQVLEDISNWALHKRFNRLRIPGLPTGEGFILTISELQAGLLSNPTVAANNLGALYIAKAALPEEVQKWRGVIGAYNDLLIVVDPRQPTLYPAGSAAPYSLTAGYVKWDSYDGRNRTYTNVKDTAYLLTAGSLIHVEGEKMHYIDDEQDYGFREGVGTAGVRGYQLPIFRDASGGIVAVRGGVIILDLPYGGTQSGMAAAVIPG